MCISSCVFVFVVWFCICSLYVYFRARVSLYLLLHLSVCARVSVFFKYLCACARVSVFIFVFPGVVLEKGPARHANLGDATWNAQAVQSQVIRVVRAHSRKVYT